MEEEDTCLTSKPEDKIVKNVICGVCLDVFPETILITLACKHQFCKECINEWFDEKPECTCPECRQIDIVQKKKRRHRCRTCLIETEEICLKAICVSGLCMIIICLISGGICSLLGLFWIKDAHAKNDEEANAMFDLIKRTIWAGLFGLGCMLIIMMLSIAIRMINEMLYCCLFKRRMLL